MVTDVQLCQVWDLIEFRYISGVDPVPSIHLDSQVVAHSGGFNQAFDLRGSCIATAIGEGARVQLSALISCVLTACLAVYRVRVST